MTLSSLQMKTDIASANHAMKMALDALVADTVYMSSSENIHLQYTIGTWASYPNATDMNHVCYNAVDYPFVIPGGYTEDDLNVAAITALTSNPSLYLLPPRCQAIVKRLVCGQAYVKPTESKVCTSVCAELFAAAGPCLGFAKLFTLQSVFNCLDTLKYSLTACNHMSAPFEVHDSIEPYIAPAYLNETVGACTGIVNSTGIYVPPFKKGLLLPMTPPFAFQIMVETLLHELMSALPVWMPEVINRYHKNIAAFYSSVLITQLRSLIVQLQDCHFDIRKFLCGNFFLVPTPYSFGVVFGENNFLTNLRGVLTQALGMTSNQAEILLDYNFHIPTPSSYSVCSSYSQSCENIIPLLVSIQPSLLPILTPFCNRTGFSPKVFASLPNPFGSPLPLIVVPTNMTDAIDMGPNEMVWQTTCPHGFVVPDDPSDATTRWIPPSGCAVACRTPYWTEAEWMVWENIVHAMSSIGLPVVLLFLFTWIADPRRRKQYLVICFGFSSGCATVIFFIMQFMSYEEKFCRNNAVGLNQLDGPNICVAQTLILEYTATACCLSWLMQCFDLYVKLVLGKKIPWLWAVYVPIIFIGPIIPTAYMGSVQLAGYGGQLPWCFTNFNQHMFQKDIDAAIFYLPILVITALGIFTMIRVMVHIALTIGRSAQSVAVTNADDQISTKSGKLGLSGKTAAQLSALRTPMMFCVFFLVIWVSLFSYRGESFRYTPIYQASFVDWIGCIFTEFVHGDQVFTFK
jgi:hypothetical protein